MSADLFARAKLMHEQLLDVTKTLKSNHATLSSLLTWKVTLEKYRQEYRLLSVLDKDGEKGLMLDSKIKKLTDYSVYVSCINYVCSHFKIAADAPVARLMNFFETNTMTTEFRYFIEKHLKMLEVHIQSNNQNSEKLMSLVQQKQQVPKPVVKFVAPVIPTKTFTIGKIPVLCEIVTTEKNRIKLDFNKVWTHMCTLGWDGGFRVGTRTMAFDNKVKMTLGRMKGPVERHGRTIWIPQFNRKIEQDAKVYTEIDLQNIAFCDVSFGCTKHSPNHHITVGYTGEQDYTPAELLNITEKTFYGLDDDGKLKYDSWGNPIGLFPSLHRAFEGAGVENYIINRDTHYEMQAPVTDYRPILQKIEDIVKYDDHIASLLKQCSSVKNMKSFLYEVNTTLCTENEESDLRTERSHLVKQLKDVTDKFNKLTKPVPIDLPHKTLMDELKTTYTSLKEKLSEIDAQLQTVKISSIEHAKLALTKELHENHKKLMQLRKNVDEKLYTFVHEQTAPSMPLVSHYDRLYGQIVTDNGIQRVAYNTEEHFPELAVFDLPLEPPTWVVDTPQNTEEFQFLVSALNKMPSAVPDTVIVSTEKPKKEKKIDVQAVLRAALSNALAAKQTTMISC